MLSDRRQTDMTAKADVLVIGRLVEACEACEALESPILAVVEASRIGVKVKVVRVTRHAELICSWDQLRLCRVNLLMHLLDRAVRMVIEQ